uniref:Cytochrome P450 n=1 Tax=Tanacetum cinerariifolium TaxID=118510 RepID=A0A6L2N8L6_TANCI|nr:cytochrome P450 [Tanacetum cinerariifolium]
MEFVTKQARLILPYGMLLTCLFKYVMGESLELFNESYVLYDRVMYPLTAQQERKNRKDCDTRRGRHSTSSSSGFTQPSSSHLKDDDDNEGTSHENAENIILSDVGVDVTTTPSLITTSFSPSPLNAPSKTPSTKDTSSTFGTTSSLFESKPQSLPPTSNNTPSLQSSNPFLDNIMDAPLRPSHPTPIQSHPSLDITLSLSPITPLDHILETSLPPSPPQPQPPIMGHPLYYNYQDYYGSTCICCSHN